MKRRIITTLVLTAVLLSVLVLPAMAKGNDDKMNKDKRPIENMRDGAGRMMDQLELTSAQMEKMEQIRFENQKWMIDMRAKMAHKMLELKEYMRNNPNEKKALSVAEEIGKLQTEIEKSRISMHFKMRNLLTDEQKETFDNMKMMDGFGPGNDRGPDFGPMKDCR